MECGICCEIMHEPVLLAPCQHLNCGGCLSDWFIKEKVCPTCRVPLQSVFKSFKHKNLIEMLLDHRPELKRDPLILGQLNATNIFTKDKYNVEAEKTPEPLKLIPFVAAARPIVKVAAVRPIVKAPLPTSDTSSDGSLSSSSSEE